MIYITTHAKCQQFEKNMSARNKIEWLQKNVVPIITHSLGVFK